MVNINNTEPICRREKRQGRFMDSESGQLAWDRSGFAGGSEGLYQGTYAR